MPYQYPVARAAACLLLAMAGVHAHAQESVPAAADPQAAVPATRYQSALGNRPEAAPTSSPDRNWVASNQKVAATNSMALTMKGMDGHAAMAGGAMCAPAAQDGGGMQCMNGKACACCANKQGAAGEGGQCMPASDTGAKAAPAADPHAHHHQEAS
jgi:hypothetical protein